MREVMIAGRGRVEVIDRALRNGIGIKVLGASAGGGKLRAHLAAHSAVVDERKALEVLEHYDHLAINADKNSIRADGVETATITYHGDGVVDWIVYLDDDVYAVGEEAAVNGVVTLELAAEIAGEYEVHIIERGGYCATGFVTVGAV